MGELGELLREAREKKGLSLAEVEEKTRVRRAQIEALEQEDFAHLPAGIYRKGLLRNYALFLGLDLGEVMKLYGADEADVGPTIPVEGAFEPPTGMAVSSWLFIDLVLGALIVACLIVVGAMAYNRQYIAFPFFAAAPTRTGSLASPVLEFTPTNTPSPTPTPTEIPSGRMQIDVQIIARTWLEVTVDGEQAFRGLIEAGTNWSWFAQDSIAMHVGNGSGILVTLNGQDLGPLGEADEVVDIEWTWEGLQATPEPLPSGTPEAATPTIAGPAVTTTPITVTPVFTATTVLAPSPTP